MVINFILPVQYMLFLTLKVTVAIDLYFINHKGPRFQLNILFIVLVKIKGIYILDELRGSKNKDIFIFELSL